MSFWLLITHFLLFWIKTIFIWLFELISCSIRADDGFHYFLRWIRIIFILITFSASIHTLFLNYIHLFIDSYSNYSILRSTYPSKTLIADNNLFIFILTLIFAHILLSSFHYFNYIPSDTFKIVPTFNVAKLPFYFLD